MDQSSCFTIGDNLAWSDDTALKFIFLEDYYWDKDSKVIRSGQLESHHFEEIGHFRGYIICRVAINAILSSQAQFCSLEHHDRIEQRQLSCTDDFGIVETRID